MSQMQQQQMQQQQMQVQMLEEMQIRESISIYNTIVERCFTDCVQSLHQSNLTEKEEGCIKRCAQKYIRHSQRVGEQFAMAQQQQQ